MPKAAALKVVKPAPVAPETSHQRLLRLIDEAGVLQEEESRLRRLKEKIRKEVESLLEIPADPMDETVVEATDFVATLAYGKQTLIDPNLLFAYSPEVFWQLVEVKKGAAEAVIPPDEFHKMTRADFTPAPKLWIRRRKE